MAIPQFILNIKSAGSHCQSDILVILADCGSWHFLFLQLYLHQQLPHLLEFTLKLAACLMGIISLRNMNQLTSIISKLNHMYPTPYFFETKPSNTHDTKIITKTLVLSGMQLSNAATFCILLSSYMFRTKSIT